WKEKLGNQNFNRIFIAIQIGCYSTPILEYFWGGLDVFAFSFFLKFFMLMTLQSSLYAVELGFC
ncbi:hypothetical protein T484DRAFT_1810040, partial [Baffinella frigidus]